MHSEGQAKPQKIQIFIDPELHRRLKITVAKHGTSGQKALLPYVLRCIEDLEKTEPGKVASKMATAKTA